MEALQLALLALRQPRMLRPYRHILLLSHMRANTSLIGHILGSHEQIDGYYELHMGYHSWRSFQRQKLKYFAKHAPKKSATSLFDKVLHNDHPVEPELFRNHSLMFTLRGPERTIPSIVRLYQNVDPSESYASVEGAASYYMERLEGLAELAAGTVSPFLFYDADDLRKRPEALLQAMTKYLELDHPLSTRYEQKPMTGAQGAGDPSAAMALGEISRQQADYGDIVVPQSLLDEARRQYAVTRAAILQSPHCLSTVQEDSSP